MKFEDASKAMREGKRIRRSTWTNTTFFYAINARKRFEIYNNDIEPITDDDILAEDWEIFEE